MRIWNIALLGLSVLGLSNSHHQRSDRCCVLKRHNSGSEQDSEQRDSLELPGASRGCPSGYPPVLGNSPSAPVITPQDIQPALGNSTATPTVTPQGVAPALAPSTPALGAQSVTPVVPIPQTPVLAQPNSTTINPPKGFTTGIGQQGFGTAIGQQGTTAIGQQGATAIGQQGATAIGQQGFGTAITPPANGVVIGQPEPFTPAAPASLPASTPVRPSPILPSQATPPMVATPVPQSPAVTPTAPAAPMRPMPSAPTSAIRVAPAHR
jgi:hypothetical protein